MSDSKSIYDIPDLQNRIRNLKQHRIELQTLKESLLADIEVKEKKLTQLRQELVVVAPNESLRFQPDDTNSGESNSLNDKRFQKMNEKLEMQILIQEIHAALPNLEKDVKAAEAAARIQSKQVSIYSKGVGNGDDSVLVMKTSAELETLLQSNVEEIMRLQSEQSAGLDQDIEYNQQLSSKISSLRRELNRLLQDKTALQESVLQSQRKPTLDIERYHCLLKQQREIRDRIQSYHDGYGWQTEAFKQLVGKEDKVVGVGNVIPVLEEWLCVDPLDASWKNEEYIQGILQEIRSGDATDQPKPQVIAREASSKPISEEEEEEEELLVIADSLATPSASKKVDQKSPITEIDLSMFCELCDRLRVLLEH